MKNPNADSELPCVILNTHIPPVIKPSVNIKPITNEDKNIILILFIKHIFINLSATKERFYYVKNIVKKPAIKYN